VELEVIMLHEISQSHKGKHHVFSLICGICGGLGGGGEHERVLEEEGNGERYKKE
jgi:hypothetical protein